MTDKPRCCVRVFDGYRDVRGHICTRAAVVERRGLPYCKQHDPERQQATQDRALRKHDAERDYRAARSAVLKAASRAIQDERVPTALTDAVSRLEAAATECREAGVEMWRLY